MIWSMRLARAVVEGEGGRGPRFRRRVPDGGCCCCFDGLVCWLIWLGGESGAESWPGESWACTEARGWFVGARLGFWVVVVFGVEDP